MRIEPRFAAVQSVQAGRLGAILKAKSAQVLVELARVPPDLLLVRAVVVPAARTEQVEQAVAVVVDEGHAAAERFENGQVRRLDILAVMVGELDARAGGPFLKQVGAGQVGVGRFLGDGCRVGRTVIARPAG